ncbi:MAG TPA: ThiF family adenylyltransferase, partial [Syntrophobacteraceae bacterium]|nr:ThiF family adenylyltransferase [Syntrophobacteraceae bacterium]
IGPGGINTFGQCAPAFGSPIVKDERLERNIRWLGEAGQIKLSRTHLAICGAGGVGALLVANVRGLGFGEITLIDPDRVEWSNLNRLAGAGAEDIEAFKVDVMKREIRRARPETRVNALAVGVEDHAAQRVLQEADVIISALDGMSPRLELQVLAARYLKPLIDIGSGISVTTEGTVRKMGSQVIVYVPGGPCLACQGMDLFRPSSGPAAQLRRSTGYVTGTDFTPTSVVTINSVVAGWAVDLLVKYLTGLKGIPLYTQIDQWSGTVQVLSFKKKAHCQICGEEGIEGKGDDPAANAMQADMDDAFSIEPAKNRHLDETYVRSA